MKKIIITIPMLADCILQNSEHLPDILKDAFDLDELKQGDFTSITQYFTETSSWDMLNSCNTNATFNPQTQEFTFLISPTYEVIHCASALRHINDFSNWVSRSYDNKQYPWEDDAWEQGYCSGDDDVDYNSSYLDCCVAMLEFYLVLNKLTYPEYTTYLNPRA